MARRQSTPLRRTLSRYVTNLPADEVDAEQIGKLYGARWAIELLFRELKSCYRLDRLPSRKAPVIEALLYAAIITLIVSHALLAALREWGRLEHRTIPLERWARLVLSAAPELLTIALAWTIHEAPSREPQVCVRSGRTQRCAPQAYWAVRREAKSEYALRLQAIAARSR